MGLVDENNHTNFYDGKVRVVDPEGNEFVKYSPDEYLDVVAERIEPWTYLGSYLKEVGWKGFVDGPESGVYQATPLSRMNAADGLATPSLKQNTKGFTTHWEENLSITPWRHTGQRLIELLYTG